MALEQVEQILDLFKDASHLTELSITSANGGQVILKRQSVALPSNVPVTAVEPVSDILADAPETVGSEPVSTTITATMVGLFHSADPGIVLDTQVEAGDIVGHIESMRLMNEVLATSGGTVKAVLIADNQPVEYGQPLFRLLA